MVELERRVRVWDAATRLFHWSIVLLIVAAYVTTRLNWMDWHVRAGYAVLTLVLFRILWGFFGSDTSRFARFLVGPRAAIGHLRHALRREPDHQPGHNPAGAWMVVLLLALLLAETLTGLFINNDIADENGRFSNVTPAAVANAITALHSWIWQALLAAVALHVLAILVYALGKGQNLIAPMVTGNKRLPQSVAAPQMAGTLRALGLLGCSVLAAAALINFL
jgi:cytochrome b